MTDEITLDAPETRLERFLAAAAGVEGITLDEPETRIERYLYKIAQGFGGGSGGGVLVVTDTNGTLDKTWQEIHDADAAVIHSTNGTNVLFGFVMAAQEARGGGYEVVRMDNTTYTAETANGYPTSQQNVV